MRWLPSWECMPAVVSRHPCHEGASRGRFTRPCRTSSSSARPHCMCSTVDGSCSSDVVDGTGLCGAGGPDGGTLAVRDGEARNDAPNPTRQNAGVQPIGPKLAEGRDSEIYEHGR